MRTLMVRPIRGRRAWTTLCSVLAVAAAANAQDCLSLLVIDDETLDNGISSVEWAAYQHSVTPEYLVNDDRPGFHTRFAARERHALEPLRSLNRTVQR